ncbi:MAG: hypothetical protein GX220_02650 [Treponema sp.]|nr:hypothetical protein [Treponema sp.]
MGVSGKKIVFDKKESSLTISFYINGEEYGCRAVEDVILEGTKHFKPGKRIVNGDEFTVRIYNEWSGIRM